MNPIRVVLRAGLILCCLCLNSSAFAIGTVSRACAFSNIPTGLKNIAAKFFVNLGADPSTLNLPNAAIDTQSRYYVLESLTTDYGRARYFLYAVAGIYAPTVDSSGTVLLATYKTEWTSQQVSKAIMNDPDYAPYYLNRENLFSARAGYDGIIQRWYWQDGVDAGYSHPIKFVVAGQHAYYDPVTKAVVQLANTRATDCNLSNLGFGFFDR